MSKSYPRGRRSSSEKNAPRFSGDQGDLFGLTEPGVIGRANAPDLHVWPELLGAICQAIREARDAGYSRDRIVDRMNLALDDAGTSVTKRQLDCWTANSKEDRYFPLEFLPAFCWATGSERPLRVLAQCLGFDLVDARESAVRELGDAEIQIARLRRVRGGLLSRLGR